MRTENDDAEAPVAGAQEPADVEDFDDLEDDDLDE